VLGTTLGVANTSDDRLVFVATFRIHTPVHGHVDIQQSGCRAAALCAAVGSGYYRGFEDAITASPPPITRLLPNAEKHRILRARFDKFKCIAEALSRVM
ncbi:MAG: hypothetical protein ACEQSN_06860, partial [Yersinia sp. (in: enterobacteria)]